jgi:beta-lactamase regulating signal transducer with metallopeptidase domain
VNLNFSFLGNDLIYRLGWTLVHTLWLGAAVAAVFAVAMTALRRRSAQSRYVVACACMAVFMACAAGAYLLTQPPQPPASAQASTPVAAPAEPDCKAVGVVDSSAKAPLSHAPSRTLQTSVEQSVPSASAALVEPAASSEPPVLSRATKAIEPALPWLVLAWALGVCVLTLWQLAGWMAARRLTRLAVCPANPGLAAAADLLAQRLGLRRVVRLLESALVRVPAVIGWLRPVILLPMGFAAGLAPAQVESILVHELGHIRRYDYLVNLLQSLVEVLLFYHPAAWYISRRVRTERENCCDDLAVAFGANQVSYAESLLHLARQSAAKQPRRRGLTLASAGVGALAKPSALRSRVGRLLGQGEESSRLARSWPIVLIALVVALTVGSAFLGASASNAADSHGLAPATQPASVPATDADLKTVVYDVRDLLIVPPNAPLPPEWRMEEANDNKGNRGPDPAAKQEDERLADLAKEKIIGLIQGTVDASSWSGRGGKGSIRDANGQLIVTQTPANQAAVLALVNHLRERHALQIRIDSQFSVPGESQRALIEGLLKKAGKDGNSADMTVMSEAQANALLERIQTDKEANRLAPPRMALLSGQQGYAMAGESAAMLIEQNKPTVAVFFGGVAIEARATVSADRKYVAMTAAARYTKLLSAEAPHPRYLRASRNATVSVPDGSWVLLRVDLEKRQLDGKKNAIPTDPNAPRQEVVTSALAPDAAAEISQPVYLLIRPEIVVAKDPNGASPPTRHATGGESGRD